MPKNASIDIHYYIDQAKIAESGLFDAFFIVDSQFINADLPAALPESAGAADACCRPWRRTRRTSAWSPRRARPTTPRSTWPGALASLDHISDGRAGWNVVTSFDSQVSKNFGLDEHLDYATRYGRALEFVEVARGAVGLLRGRRLPRRRRSRGLPRPGQAARRSTTSASTSGSPVR